MSISCTPLAVIKKNIESTEAMNTYNPIPSEIKRGGYNIKTRLNESQNEIGRWIAQKHDLKIIGFNSSSLLGLTIIAEQYGNNWNKVHTEDRYDRILKSDEV